MRSAIGMMAVLVLCLGPAWGGGSAAGPPVVSPYDDGRPVSDSSVAATGAQAEGRPPVITASGITIDVYASSAPNASGSPSWSGYMSKALYALENGLAVNGNRLTDPTAYERAAAYVPGGEIAVTSFKSWRGVVDPPAPFANELGNRMHFGLHAVGDGTSQFALNDLTFALHSSDPDDSLVFTGNFIGYTYNGTSRYGINWGADRVKGGGDDSVYTSGNSTTLVDEIVYVGVGNAWWPGGDDPNPGNPDEGKQGAMDDYFAWLASVGPIDVTCTYGFTGTGASGSGTVTIIPPPLTYTVSGWGPTQYPGPFPAPPGAPNPSYPGDTVEFQTYTGTLNLTPGTYVQKINTLLWKIDWTYNGTNCSLSDDGPPPGDWPPLLFPINAARTMSFGTGPGETSSLSQTGLLEATWDNDYLTAYAGSTSTFFVPGYKIKVTPGALARQPGTNFSGNPPWIQPNRDVMATFEVIDLAPAGALVLVPNKACYNSGETVTVQLWMYGVSHTIVGGQFFLQYNTSKLTFVSATAESPFVELYEQYPGSGQIDYAVQIPPPDTTTGDAEMAVLTFTAAAEICTDSNLITWRDHDPPTRLSNDQGQGVVPLLVAMDVADTVPPVITYCPPDVTIECNVAPTPANTGGPATATDNCDPAPVVTYSDGANLCGCGLYTGKITRTWTATDHCGNASTCTQLITVQDTEVPVISGLTVTGGDVDANCEKTVTFLATVTDNCCVNAADVDVVVALLTGNATLGTPSITKNQTNAYTVTISGSVLVSDVESCPATVQVTVNADDCCGNPATQAQATGAVNDITAPGITCPANVTVHADAGACTAALVEVFDFETFNPPNYDYYADPGCVAERSGAHPFGGSWSAHLVLHNSGDYARVRAPITGIPGLTVDNVSAMFQSYIVPGSTANLGPYVMLDIDANGNGVWDNTPDDAIVIAFVTGAAPVGQGCWYTDGLNGATTVHVVGNRTGLLAAEFSSSAGGGLMSALRTHVFSGSLTWGDLGVLNVRVGAGLWPGSGYFECYVDDILVAKSLEVPPGGSDNCGGPVITGVRSDGQALKAPYPSSGSGVTAIRWKATDCCGNFSTCGQTITVNAFNELVVNLDLEWSFTGTRCITFELWDCGPPLFGPVEKKQVLTFVNGSATNQLLLVPCDVYTCITARDWLHTLRRTAAPAVVGGQYVVNFTGGDKLIGGNLNDDFWVDILDFGVFSWQWNTNYGIDGGNTTCTTPYPHADISGNAVVSTEDFTFIQINFLKGNEANCCGLPLSFSLEGAPAPLAAGGPRASITVAELKARGMGELAVADLNGDGKVDQMDIVAWMRGARPGQPLPTPPPPRPRGR